MHHSFISLHFIVKVAFDFSNQTYYLHENKTKIKGPGRLGYLFWGVKKKKKQPAKITHFSSAASFPLGQAPPPGSVIGSLDRKAVDVHGELPEVAADPGSVEDTKDKSLLRPLSCLFMTIQTEMGGGARSQIFTRTKSRNTASQVNVLRSKNNHWPVLCVL